MYYDNIPKTIWKRFIPKNLRDCLISQLMIVL
ncbi:hypothetical protein KRIGEM_00048 [Komagataeibacter rhaeticus]|nr:hypothetical protein KRIGEM_00048 [Komagataeibacter rhaeticus]